MTTLAEARCAERIATGGYCCWNGFADKDCDPPKEKPVTAEDDETDDYWPVPPIQEPTGALNPALADSASGESDLDAHGDAEGDHDPGEQPGPSYPLIGLAIAVLAIGGGLCAWGLIA